MKADQLRDLDGFEQAWLAAGSLIAVGLLALATLAVFGTVASLVVLLIGTALAIRSNPSVWLPDTHNRTPPPTAPSSSRESTAE